MKIKSITKFVLSFLIIALLTLTLVSAWQTPPPPAIKLSGFVKENNNPVTGMKIIIENKKGEKLGETETIEQGYYTLIIDWDDPDTVKDEGLSLTHNELNFIIKGYDITQKDSLNVSIIDAGEIFRTNLNIAKKTSGEVETPIEETTKKEDSNVDKPQANPVIQVPEESKEMDDLTDATDEKILENIENIEDLVPVFPLPTGGDIKERLEETKELSEEEKTGKVKEEVERREKQAELERAAIISDTERKMYITITGIFAFMLLLGVLIFLVKREHNK